MTARRRLPARRSKTASSGVDKPRSSVIDGPTTGPQDGSGNVVQGSIDAIHVDAGDDSTDVSGVAADAPAGSGEKPGSTDEVRADDEGEAGTEDYDATSPVEGRDDSDGDDSDQAARRPRRGRNRRRPGAASQTRARLVNAAAFVVLPALALIFAVAFGYLKWYDATARATQLASIDAVAAARDTTVAILAYQPDTVEATLGTARNRLTGSFRDEYTRLVKEVVVPGAKEKKVKTLVTVPAAGVISASPDHAVVMVYINQNVTMGDDPPTDTASAVKVALDKVGERWLISGFDPI